MTTHDQQTHQQFGTVAAAYLTSSVHAQGADLTRVAAHVSQTPAAKVLDLGCGAGHLSFAMAPHAASVVAVDLSQAMLEVVATEAHQRGLGNIAVEQASAESLPFADAGFDYVCTRFSAHHWGDIRAGLREAHRVLKPGGELVVIDIVAPESPLCDTYMQAIELLRDVSHVRDYAPSEWRRLLGEAGFEVMLFDSWRLRMEFDSWTARMRTPALHVSAIRALIDAAPREVRAHLGVDADYGFDLEAGLICSRRV